MDSDFDLNDYYGEGDQDGSDLIGAQLEFLRLSGTDGSLIAAKKGVQVAAEDGGMIPRTSFRAIIVAAVTRNSYELYNPDGRDLQVCQSTPSNPLNGIPNPEMFGGRFLYEGNLEGEYPCTKCPHSKYVAVAGEEKKRKDCIVYTGVQVLVPADWDSPLVYDSGEWNGALWLMDLKGLSHKGYANWFARSCKGRAKGNRNYPVFFFEIRMSGYKPSGRSGKYGIEIKNLLPPDKLASKIGREGFDSLREMHDQASEYWPSRWVEPPNYGDEEAVDMAGMEDAALGSIPF